MLDTNFLDKVAERDAVFARQLFKLAFPRMESSFLVGVETAAGGAEVAHADHQSYFNFVEADQVVSIVLRLIKASNGSLNGGTEDTLVAVTSPCRAQVSFAPETRW
jgi:hypothetical protein